MVQEVSIRPLQANDGPAWFRIYESVAAEGRWIGSEAPVPPDWQERAVEKFVGQPDRVMYLSEVGDTPVGWISVEPIDGAAAIGMGVLEAHRHQGVGTALMESAIAWAVDHGFDRMVLDVFPHNEAAIGLYRKLGFIEAELSRGAFERRNGELWDLLRMERNLQSKP